MTQTTENRNIYIVANFGEIFLKGANVGIFEKKLLKNFLEKLGDLQEKVIFKKKTGGSFFMELDLDISEDEVLRIENIVKNTPGFATYYRAYFCKTNMEDIGQLAGFVASEYIEKNKDSKTIKTFAMSVEKSDKEAVKMQSMDVTIASATVVYDVCKKMGYELSVNLGAPDIKIHVKMKKNKTYVFTHKKQAVGGLPIGSAGNAIALFSGGIDSPVAAYLAMKRGLHVTAVHFHSVPKTNPKSIEKVKELLQELSKFQKNIKLYLVPIIDVQQGIVKNADRKLSIVLQRRAFLQMVTKIAEGEKEKYGRKIQGFVTGDALGQVASQTMENMAAVSEVLDGKGKIIFRPLITYDKKEIMDLARNIGTLAISEKAHEDACSLFVPKKPETKANIWKVKQEEGKLDTSVLDRVLEKAEIFEI